jgi:hypothetical protein
VAITLLQGIVGDAGMGSVRYYLGLQGASRAVECDRDQSHGRVRRRVEAHTHGVPWLSGEDRKRDGRMVLRLLPRSPARSRR